MVTKPALNRPKRTKCETKSQIPMDAIFRSTKKKSANNFKSDENFYLKRVHLNSSRLSTPSSRVIESGSSATAVENPSDSQEVSRFSSSRGVDPPTSGLETDFARFRPRPGRKGTHLEVHADSGHGVHHKDGAAAARPAPLVHFPRDDGGHTLAAVSSRGRQKISIYHIDNIISMIYRYFFDDIRYFTLF